MTVRAALLLVLLSPPAAAHDYPIAPVKAVLRVQPDRVVLDLDSDSIYWIEEVVGLHPMPPHDWPEDARAKTEDYVNEHFRLLYGGETRALGRLTRAAYVQRPWEVNEQGRFRLRVVYPAIAEDSALSGDVDFFEDYRRERLEAGQPVLPNQEFKTDLSVPGRVAHRFALTPGANDFAVPAAEARRGGLGRSIDGLRIGFMSCLGASEAWAALLALALALGPARPSSGRIAVCLVAGLIGAAFSPWPAPSWLPWAAGLIAALAAGQWLGPLSVGGEAAVCAVLARVWMTSSEPWLPRAVPGPSEHIPAAAGAVSAAAILLALGITAVAAERRRLVSVSESRADELFQRRRRLAATALLLACGCGIFQNLP